MNDLAFSLPTLKSRKKAKATSSPTRIPDQTVRNYFRSFPSEQELSESFGQAFVINKPMSGVGGDGYWQYQTDDLSFLVVFDCMGHGRFASMMTRFYLRIIYKVIVGQKLTEPSVILHNVHNLVKQEYKNQGQLAIGTGADMGVLIYNRKLNTLKYSGACMDLVMKSGSLLDKIKSNRRQVGDHFHADRTYETSTFSNVQNQKCYLFSDGVTDLFGGPKQKKFGFKNLSNLLTRDYLGDSKGEKLYIEKQLNFWAGANEPLDDMLMIGLRFGN